LTARPRRRDQKSETAHHIPADNFVDNHRIPLNTNASENDIRACVIKRKVSGGTMSAVGRTARDVLLGLMKTCRKLGVSFYRYLGDRMRVPGAQPVPPLPDLVRQAATTA
jgi:hypothetical protein